MPALYVRAREEALFTISADCGNVRTRTNSLFTKSQLLPINLSDKNVANDFAVNIRQPHIAPPKPVRQAGVVDAEQMQHRGMQVMDRDFVFDGVEAVFVRGAIHDAAPHAAA